MRYLILAALAGCCMDYEVVDQCVDAGDYVACLEPVSRERAGELCHLVEQPGSREEAEAMAWAIEVAGGDPLWMGANDAYECAAISSYGSWSPVDCAQPRGYLCEAGRSVAL